MIVGAVLAAWLADRAARAATQATIVEVAARWREATPLAALARALDVLERPGATAVAALIRPLLEDAGWVGRAGRGARR